MKRFLRIWRTIFSTSLQVLFEYRSDAALLIGGGSLVQLAALSFLWVVLHEAGTVNGWTGSQVLLLMGLAAMSQGLSEQFFDNIWRLPQYVLRGDLDRLLVYPVRPLPLLLVALPQIHALGNFLTGLAFTVVSLVRLEAAPVVWVLVPLWAVCGCVVYTSLLVAAASLAFHVRGTIDHLFVIYHFLHANRFPLTAFPRVVQLFFLVVIPFGACIFLPASWATGRLTGPVWAILPVFAAGATALVAAAAWSRGIRRYESAGA